MGVAYRSVMIHSQILDKMHDSERWWQLGTGRLGSLSRSTASQSIHIFIEGQMSLTGDIFYPIVPYNINH